MQCSRLSRIEFGALLTERKPGQEDFPNFRQDQPESPPLKSEMWVCWSVDKNRADELPRIVVVADEVLEDFFAWAITFLPNYRPLTSFLRVLPWSVFSELQKRKAPRVFENRSVLIGLILGETLTNATGRGFIESLPLTAFESTYSYAIGRAIALGFDDFLLPYISAGWQSARKFGEQRGRRMSPEFLESVWGVVLLLAGDRSSNRGVFRQTERIGELLQACEEISARGQLSTSALERLSLGRISPLLFVDAMRLPREQRVVAFERAMQDLATSPTSEPGINFVVGYLASLVGDGSLEHAHLVFPLQAQFPTAMLWYGICAALPPTTRVLLDYGHLGLRILRLLDRKDDILDTPYCDISLSELEIMIRGEPRSRSFRQAHASFLRVELAPCITTVIRSIGVQGSTEQPGLFTEEGRQTNLETDRLRELVFTLKSGLSLAETLLTKSNDPNGGGEAESRHKRRR